MLNILIVLLIGGVLGYFIKLGEKGRRINGRLQQVGVSFLLFLMGASIGADEKIVNNLTSIGLKAFLFAAFTILGSIIVVYILSEKFIIGKKQVIDESDVANDNDEKNKHSVNNINTMTYIILISVVLGTLSGYFIISPELMKSADRISSIVLIVVIFFVGIDIGGNSKIFKDLKKLGFKILLIPIGIILGSLIGGVFIGSLLKMSINESLSIGGGFGWYSLSGIILKELGGETLGAIAFLSNVFREMFTVMLIPIIATKLNFYTTIAPAGATSMDTTLPLISKATNPEITIVSFINGVILSTLVPILVPFFYKVFI